MWKRHSDNYSRHFESISSKIYTQLLSMSQLSTAKSIVEVSCGTGNGLEMMRKDLKINTKIHASDVSKHMIEKSKNRRLGNIFFSVAENSNLPYPSSFCDRYIANLSLHIVRKRSEMVKEAFRILQDEGVASFSVFSQPSPSNIIQMIEETCEESEFWLKNRSLFELKDMKKNLGLIGAVGFIEAEVSESSFFFDISSVDMALKFAYDLFLYQKLAQNPLDHYSRLLQRLQSKFTQHLSTHSKFSLDIRFITVKKPIFINSS